MKTKHKSNHKSIFIVFALLLSLVTTCSQNQATIETEPSAVDEIAQITLTSEQLKNTSVTTENPALLELSSLIDVIGFIELPPNRKLDIRVPLSGKVTQIDLLPGMKVKKGQVLITLTDIQYLEVKKNAKLTKTALEFEQADFKKQQELWESRAIPEREYFQSKASYEKAHIEHQSALAALKKFRLVIRNRYNARFKHIFPN